VEKDFKPTGLVAMNPRRVLKKKGGLVEKDNIAGFLLTDMKRKNFPASPWGSPNAVVEKKK